MRHLKAINRKAARVVQAVRVPAGDVVALQEGSGPPQQPEGPHIPLGWVADCNRCHMPTKWRQATIK